MPIIRGSPAPAGGSRQRCVVAFVVVQVDRSSELGPFTYERAALAAAGGELREFEVTDPADVVGVAKDADVVWLAWSPDLTGDILAAAAALPAGHPLGRGPRADRLRGGHGAGHRGRERARLRHRGRRGARHRAAAGERQAPGAGHHEQMRAGGWPAAVDGTVHRIKGRTLGVIGVGRIGSAAARRGLGLGMRVIGYDNARPDAELRAMGVEPVDLATLAAQADYVTVHTPYSASSHHLVDAALIAALQAGHILVNTSRGKVLDQAAVDAALRSGHLAAAGLDVFETEPLPADDPIRSAPNVILTPHHASFSDEAMVDLRAEMCRTTIEFMTTGWAGAIVNPAGPGPPQAARTRGREPVLGGRAAASGPPRRRSPGGARPARPARRG